MICFHFHLLVVQSSWHIHLHCYWAERDWSIAALWSNLPLLMLQYLSMSALPYRATHAQAYVRQGKPVQTPCIAWKAVIKAVKLHGTRWQ
jgi:hypothetical protein